MKNRNVVYALCVKYDILSVSSSLEELSKSVAHHLDRYYAQTLHYIEFELDYYNEPIGWGWAYIAPDAIVKELAEGGGSVPKKEFWGRNLINEKWQAIPHDEIKKLYALSVAPLDLEVTKPRQKKSTPSKKENDGWKNW